MTYQPRKCEDTHVLHASMLQTTFELPGSAALCDQHCLMAPQCADPCMYIPLQYTLTQIQHDLQALTMNEQYLAHKQKGSSHFPIERERKVSLGFWLVCFIFLLPFSEGHLQPLCPAPMGSLQV